MEPLLQDISVEDPNAIVAKLPDQRKDEILVYLSCGQLRLGEVEAGRHLSESKEYWRVNIIEIHVNSRDRVKKKYTGHSKSDSQKSYLGFITGKIFQGLVF